MTLLGQSNLDETQKLASLARVWGFLKYHHPNITNGSHDWDQELIQKIPQVEAAQSPQALQDIYINWLESLGKVRHCGTCKPIANTDFSENYHLEWITDTTIFSKNLSQKMMFIARNKKKSNEFYAMPVKGAGNIQILHEPAYHEMAYPAESYRLLALFRYWNIIAYFYPYKYCADQPWDEVLTELIPKFKDCSDTLAYHMALLEMVNKINDSHGVFTTPVLNQYKGSLFPPVVVKIIANSVVITDYFDSKKAWENDLQIGDVITAIDHEDISSLLQQKLKITPGSNPAAKMRNVAMDLLRSNKSRMLFSIVRAGEPMEKTVEYYPYASFNKPQKPIEPAWKILKNEIGYVAMGELQQGDVAALQQDLDSLPALIFDLRQSPHNTLFDLADWLLPESRPFVKFSKPDMLHPGNFYWDAIRYCGTNNPKHYKGKIILLVNEYTQSHAEFTCMGLQTADQVTIIGSQTAGADGNVSKIVLPGGYYTLISGIGAFYPDGRETQRIGIVPDIVAKPTLTGIREGRDDVLEAAIKFAQTH